MVERKLFKVVQGIFLPNMLTVCLHENLHINVNMNRNARICLRNRFMTATAGRTQV